MTEVIADRLLAAAEGGDLPAYAAALAAIPVQRLNTIGKLPAFQQSVARLVPTALAASASADRLAALALIGRADSTTQQKQPAIAEAARAAVAEPPPQFDAEGLKSLTPDDRYYLALVVARADADWVAPYAARALVEEGGEPRSKNDVRKAFAELVFARSPTLADAFLRIAEAVPQSSHEDPGTKEAELSRSRRLAKLFPALEDATRAALADNGDDLSAAFITMMQALVFRFGRPWAGTESDGAAAAVVEASLMLLSTLLRTRFLISVETDAYKTVGRIKYWHRTDSWPKSASAGRERLSQTLLQAIALRAKTGHASQELLSVLIQLAGDRRRIEPHIARLADQQGVPEEVQDWLRAGGKQTPPRFATAAGEEAGLRDVDTLLASAAVRAAHVQSLVQDQAKAALVHVRGQDDLGDAARTLTQTLNFARALSVDVGALARRRSLSLFGEPGEMVIAEARRHRQENGQLIQTERVRIERPGVERALPNGTTEIILQASATPVESKRK